MIITDQKIYDGNLIHSKFAYNYYRDKISALGDIVAFRAPAKVEVEGMIDKEDVLSNDFIYSDDMIHFCIEIPNICPVGMVAFQRLFNTQIANILSSKYLKKPIEVDGDDMMVHDEFNNKNVTLTKGKCSVSICYVNNNTGLMHTGINVLAGAKAPIFAYSTKLTDEQIANFMSDCVLCFYNLTHDMFIATRKITI